MAYKAPSQPCDLFREHMLLNSGSFSTIANTDTGFWREIANIAGLPSRPGRLRDTTAYATPPAADSWNSRVRGWVNARYNAANSTAGGLT